MGQAKSSSQSSQSPQYWVVVGSKENYEISRDRGFDLQGIKTRARKKALTIQPGDYMMYYLTGLKKLPAIIRVTQPMVEDYTPIWTCSSKAPDGSPEVYPFRFPAEPCVIIPDEDQWIDVTPIHGSLTYLTKWPAKNWTLGFQGNLHQWPESDFQLVYGHFKKTPGVTMVRPVEELAQV